MKRKNHRLARQCNGLSMIEAAMGCFLMTCIAAIGVNITLLTFAASANDSACRDAARAAAQCNTSTVALQAAQAQMKLHATDGFFISQPSLTSTSSPGFVYQDYSGNPPANTSSYVTVTTTVSVRVPCPILFFGVSTYSNGSIVFTRQYSFPIIKEKFYG